MNSTCSYLGDKEELLSAHHQCLHSQSLLLLMKSGNRLDIFFNLKILFHKPAPMLKYQCYGDWKTLIQKYKQLAENRPNEILHADDLIRGTKPFIMPNINTKKLLLPYQANFIPELRLQTRKQAENEQTVNRGYL